MFVSRWEGEPGGREVGGHPRDHRSFEDVLQGASWTSLHLRSLPWLCQQHQYVSHIYINLIQSPAVWSKCSVWTMLLSVLSAALARQKVCVWKDYFSQKLFMEGFTFILCFFHMFKLKFGGCVFVFVYCAVWNWRVSLLCFDLESKWLMRTFLNFFCIIGPLMSKCILCHVHLKCLTTLCKYSLFSLTTKQLLSLPSHPPDSTAETVFNHFSPSLTSPCISHPSRSVEGLFPTETK